MAQGPLDGVKVVEFAGLGPAPFCGMLLSDLGADVVRIDRKDARPRQAASRDASRAAVDGARSQEQGGDRAVPRSLRARRDRVRRISARRDGAAGAWARRRAEAQSEARLRAHDGLGTDGPLAQAAGHDINYIAITGALHAIGTRETPVPPLNLVGDFGGGALYLAFGLLAASDACARDRARARSSTRR